MDESQKYHAKQKKADTRESIYYMIPGRTGKTKGQ